MAITLTTHQLINQIFLPKEQSPWGRFPVDMLDRYGFHPSTMMFYHANADAVAVLLHRKEPSSSRYVGNFPCAESLIKTLAIFEREEDLSAAYFVTTETPDGPQAISVLRAAELSDRCIGHVRPMTSPLSGDDYYWLDADMFPIRLDRSRERRYRVLVEDPPFLLGRASK